MGASRVFESLNIHSHKGPYQVYFSEMMTLDVLDDEVLQSSHFIIDKKIAEIYNKKLKKIINLPSTLLIEAIEQNKSLDQFPQYVEHFVKHKIRRNHCLIALGGGIIQDITCFLASTILRGVHWWFYPTTLLSQADSCIGSKSSVNCGNIKNILGTYNPPKQIYICAEFINSLDHVDVRSGVGEMLKVHAIDSVESFDQIARDYEKLFINFSIMLNYVYRSLVIKKNIIEQDEFDQGVRNVMNYGHTFGHAIESATKYQIPHGVAVTIGMDIANYVSAEFGYGVQEYFHRMHPTLKKNYHQFVDTEISIQPFIDAISKDKKNRGKNQLGLILPDKTNKLSRVYLDNDERFKLTCQKYLAEIRALGIAMT
ncbi:MAG: hypothetical protein ACD_45C00099G0002 [uncultured bacterium]|nr:MAG: hypothetical protein ACD_45C00099G0002 [uncultured bacterium]